MQRIAPFIAMTAACWRPWPSQCWRGPAHRGSVGNGFPLARTSGRPVAPFPDRRRPFRGRPGLRNLLGIGSLPLGGPGGSGCAQLRGIRQPGNRRPLQGRRGNSIERAGAMLPGDAVVIGDPFNGETYFYALTGRRVVYTQLGAPTAGSSAKELLRTGFNRIATDKSICEAVLKVGATHFYEDAPGGRPTAASA